MARGVIRAALSAAVLRPGAGPRGGGTGEAASGRVGSGRTRSATRARVPRPDRRRRRGAVQRAGRSRRRATAARRGDRRPPHPRHGLPPAAPRARSSSRSITTRPQGHAAVGHAIAGVGENWYHGEGTGTARSTPYPDSAPHRAATTVSATVEARSQRLARLLASRYGAVFTRANGARSGSVRLEPRSGNRRMMRYFGYYRSRADARVLIEAGAGGTDGAILRNTDLVAGAIAGAIVAHLRAEGRLVDPLTGRCGATRSAGDQPRAVRE